MLNKAEKPVVIGDVELIRFKLQKDFAGFLDKTGFPYVTMMLGKTSFQSITRSSSDFLRGIGAAITCGIGLRRLTASCSSAA